jgi:hypothetical protein
MTGPYDERTMNTAHLIAEALREAAQKDRERKLEEEIADLKTKNRKLKRK